MYIYIFLYILDSISNLKYLSEYIRSIFNFNMDKTYILNLLSLILNLLLEFFLTGSTIFQVLRLKSLVLSLTNLFLRYKLKQLNFCHFIHSK